MIDQFTFFLGGGGGIFFLPSSSEENGGKESEAGNSSNGDGSFGGRHGYRGPESSSAAAKVVDSGRAVVG